MRREKEREREKERKRQAPPQGEQYSVRFLPQTTI
jgi:hypothetical protein